MRQRRRSLGSGVFFGSSGWELGPGLELGHVEDEAPDGVLDGSSGFFEVAGAGLILVDDFAGDRAGAQRRAVVADAGGDGLSDPAGTPARATRRRRRWGASPAGAI